jgi:hypothetical protein
MTTTQSEAIRYLKLNAMRLRNGDGALTINSFMAISVRPVRGRLDRASFLEHVQANGTEVRSKNGGVAYTSK